MDDWAEEFGKALHGDIEAADRRAMMALTKEALVDELMRHGGFKADRPFPKYETRVRDDVKISVSGHRLVLHTPEKMTSIYLPSVSSVRELVSRIHEGLYRGP